MKREKSANPAVKRYNAVFHATVWNEQRHDWGMERFSYIVEADDKATAQRAAETKCVNEHPKTCNMWCLRCIEITNAPAYQTRQTDIFA